MLIDVKRMVTAVKMIFFCKNDRSVDICFITAIITIFTWLNTTATISPVTKIDVATIQGQLLLEGGVYCTKHYYVRLLLKLTSNSKKYQVCCAIMSIP